MTTWALTKHCKLLQIQVRLSFKWNFINILQAKRHRFGQIWDEKSIIAFNLSNGVGHNYRCTVANVPQKVFRGSGIAVIEYAQREFGIGHSTIVKCKLWQPRTRITVGRTRPKNQKPLHTHQCVGFEKFDHKTGTKKNKNKKICKKCKLLSRQIRHWNLFLDISLQAIKKAVLFFNRFKWFFETLELFLELHFIKIILILAFLLGINEVCFTFNCAFKSYKTNFVCNLCCAQVSAVHISIVILSVIAVTSRTNTQTIYSGFISLTVGVLFILKMVYQIEYIKQSIYDVNCTVRLVHLWYNFTVLRFNLKNSVSLQSSATPIIPPNPDNGTVANGTVANATEPIVLQLINDPNNNTANWLGFNKLEEGQNLMDLLNGYITYIVALTVYNLILMHQQRKR